MSGKSGVGSQINGHFRRRWKDHFNKQYGVIRSVVDSVVLLYIGIPAMLIFGRSYYVLWEKELPDWLMQLPYAVIPILLYFLIYIGGGLMTYQENADVLFLRQSRQWSRGIVWRGIVASIVTQALALGLVILVLLPILLRGYAMNGAEIWLLYTVTSGIKAVAMLSENLIGIFTTRWRTVLFQSLIQLGLGALFMTWALVLHESWAASLLIILILLTAAVWMGRIRTHIAGRFEAEIRLEESQKTRLTGMIISGAVSSPRKAKTRPWIFRRSNPLLKSRKSENRVAEATLKSFYRGREFVVYVQFIGVGIIAVVAPPFPANVIVFILLMALLHYWLNGYRMYFLEKDLMAMLPASPELKNRSAAPSNRLLMLPGVIFISAGLGISLFETIWGIALAIPAAFVLFVPYSGQMLQRWNRE